MNIKILIESIGLSSKELKEYLNKEVNEFLQANNLEDQRDEFNDILFALKSMSYAHSKNHFDLNDNLYKDKILKRLKTRATISKKETIYEHEAIRKIPIGVIHFAFGNFKQPWSHFDPLKNGTEDEITMLTDNQFIKNDNFTNHLIITFDYVSNIEFSVIASGWKFAEKNTILCRVPDFLFEYSKKLLKYKEVEEMLAAQIFAALSKITISKDTIFHFHSWETGVILSSEEIKKIIGQNKKIFSPYLTISRLSDFIKNNKDQLCTLNQNEAIFGSYYEKKLIDFCNESICESEMDANYYNKNISENKIKIVSYLKGTNKNIKPRNDLKELIFIAGGRPVYEKGFLQLCEEFSEIVKWSKDKNFNIKLLILCKEYKRSTGEPKGVRYIEEIKEKCKKLKIDKYVSIEDKVSLGELKKIIQKSSALVVPSLYDPFCLMPLYALDVNTVSFVSKYAGISENIQSKEYVFDPCKKYDLLNLIKEWINKRPVFKFNSKHDSYKNLYLKNKK